MKKKNAVIWRQGRYYVHIKMFQCVSNSLRLITGRRTRVMRYTGSISE